MSDIFVTLENIIADVFYNSTSVENLNFVKNSSNNVIIYHDFLPRPKRGSRVK